MRTTPKNVPQNRGLHDDHPHLQITTLTDYMGRRDYQFSNTLAKSWLMQHCVLLYS